MEAQWLLSFGTGRAEDKEPNIWWHQIGAAHPILLLEAKQEVLLVPAAPHQLLLPWPALWPAHGLPHPLLVEKQYHHQSQFFSKFSCKMDAVFPKIGTNGGSASLLAEVVEHAWMDLLPPEATASPCLMAGPAAAPEPMKGRAS